MVDAALGKENLKLLPDGLDEVRFECGHGAYSFRSGSVKNSPDDGASVPALHTEALPIDGNSKGGRWTIVFRPAGPRTTPSSGGKYFHEKYTHLLFEHPLMGSMR